MASGKKGKQPSYWLSATEFDALVERLAASPGKGVDAVSLARVRAVMVDRRQAVEVAAEEGIKARVITDRARQLMAFHLLPDGAMPAPTVRPTYRLTAAEFLAVENKLAMLTGRRKPEAESMARARAVMVDGKTAADVAAEVGIAAQNVTALVRRLWTVHQTPFEDLQKKPA